MGFWAEWQCFPLLRTEIRVVWLALRNHHSHLFVLFPYRRRVVCEYFPCGLVGYRQAGQPALFMRFQAMIFQIGRIYRSGCVRLFERVLRRYFAMYAGVLGHWKGWKMRK